MARHLRSEWIDVVEVERPDRKARRFEGKSDPADALVAARAVLSGRATATPKTKDGAVEAVRVLEVVYHGAVKDRTRAINQFKALVVTAPEALRANLGPITFTNQLQRARRFAEHGDLVEAETRLALKEIARRIRFLDEQNTRLEGRIGELAAKASPALIGVSGAGAHVAAQLLAAAGDNPHRMRSEATFAKVGGCPFRSGPGHQTDGRTTTEASASRPARTHFPVSTTGTVARHED